MSNTSNTENQKTEPENSDSDTKALKSLFRIALETRNFEIQQLVQRNNFFMIFQGVLLSGVIQSSNSKPVVIFLVCSAGLLVSIFQVRMASGAKFWQEYWEAALHKVEILLIKKLHAENDRGSIFHLFHEDLNAYQKMVSDRLARSGTSLFTKLIMKKYSVSKTPIYTGVALCCIWSFLILCSMRGYAPFGVPSFIVGF